MRHQEIRSSGQDNQKWIQDHGAKIQKLSADTQKARADVQTAARAFLGTGFRAQEEAMFFRRQ